LGAITVAGSTIASVKRNVPYQTISHATKLVVPGSVRVSSSPSSGPLLNVVFQTPNKTVLQLSFCVFFYLDVKTMSNLHLMSQLAAIVMNDGGGSHQFTFTLPNGKTYSGSLNGGEIGSYVLK
jgi:hypothetical protein